MGKRLELQALLENLLGSRNVYFQPPSSIQLQYPCIIYKRDSAKTKFADDNPYLYTKRYMVTVIDRNPDSVLPDKVALLPKTSFSRHFQSENLNHDVFTIFY